MPSGVTKEQSDRLEQENAKAAEKFLKTGSVFGCITTLAIAATALGGFTFAIHTVRQPKSSSSR